LKKRLLIVEDSELSRDLLVQIFEDTYDVDVAADGGTAVVIAATAELDLILMDIGLPGLNGLAAVRSIRAGGSSVPIVAVSSHVMPGDREVALAAGCDDFMPKPFDDALLVETVRRLTDPG
jgi:CheY-like chemotaxis protein